MSNTQETFTVVIKKEPDWFIKEISNIIIHIKPEDVPMIDEIEKLRQKYLEASLYPALANKPRPWM